MQEYINKVHNCDCLELLKELPDKSIDLVLNDPPYGINYLSNWTNNHSRIENDKFQDWNKNLPLWLKEFKRILTDTGVCCCCCCGGGKTPVTAIFTMEAIKYFNLIQTLVWHKFIGLGWKYRPAYENIVVLSKSKDNYNFYDDSKKLSNVIVGINQQIPNAEQHPTQKPLKLMEKLILIHSKKNDIILDPFLGSGTTAVACERLGRQWIGCEISKKYCKIAEARIREEQAQGKLNLV